VLGKHSGRHAFRARLNALGYDLSKAQLDDAFVRFKQLCDRKKTIGDADLEALVGDEITKAHEYYKLEALQVSCGFPVTPRANVTLRGPDGATHSAEASGDGPVDAAYQAIAQIVGKQNRLTDFSIHAVTPGRDALGRVSVRVQNGAREAMGHVADTDIIVASAKAYVNALNKLMAGPIA